MRHWGRGPGSHPSLISPEPLRLLWNYNWGLLLLLWSAKSNLGPEAGTTLGTYHVYRGSRAHGWERQCTALTLRLDKGKPRLGQGTDGAGLAVAGCGKGGTRAGHGWWS